MSKIIYSISEASVELGASELAVMRAKALGTFQGTMIDGISKFSSNQLQDFVGRGCPNLSVPQLEAGDAWFQTGTIDRYSAAIEGTVRDMIGAIIPDTPPAEAVDGSQTTITLPLTPEMQLFLANRPSRDPFRTPNTPELQFATNADVFAASKQSATLQRLCSDPKNPVNGLQMLYRSPQDFKQLCTAARTQFDNSFVSVSKTYRPQGSYGFGLVCSWQISCKTFGSSDVLKTLV